MSRRAIAGLILIVAGAGMALAGALGALPAAAPAALRFTGMGIGLVALAAGLILSAGRPGPVDARRLRANLAVGAASTLVTLLLVELLARFWLWNLAPADQFRYYATLSQLQRRYGEDFYRSDRALMVAHPYLGYVPNPSYRDGENYHNALGYRGEEVAVPKPDGVFRIACLGGSTTYGAYVTNAETYPAALEAYLHEQGYRQVEVINAGVNGYTSWESLINLEMRVLDLEPDLVIIYHGINDVHPRLVWPPEAYRGDNTGYRARPLAVITPGPWDFSTALRIVLVATGAAESYSDIDSILSRWAAVNYADLFEEQQRAGTYPQGIFAEHSAMDMLEANPPVYFERNLRSMAGIAAANGFEIVLATFAYSPDFPDQPRVASAEYQRAYREGWDAMRRVAESTDAHLFDFAAAFPDDPSYFSDGRHFTPEGNRLMGQLFGEYLIAQGLLPEP